jgi:LCP family protein required for cell wall assembly
MKFPQLRKPSLNMRSGWFGRGVAISVLLLALAGLIIGGLNLAARQNQSSSNEPLSEAQKSANGLLSSASTPGPTLTPTIVLPTPDPWDGKSRVTVLVLGVDSADWQSPDRVGPPRSDTMILLTVDPLSKTAGILSIPRDLWVSIPGIQEPSKINTAYRFGELYKMPGGGPGLAMRTVEALLGVPINFYVRVDFDAFQGFIDELGGIDITIPQEIKIDPVGPGNTLVLQPGKQHLDGATVLAYARNRYTANDDFDRMARQQQVILAVRDRVLSLSMLPRLVLKAPALYAKVQQGVQTNISLQQAIQLAWLAQEIPSGNIKAASIGLQDVTFSKSPDGEDIYIPIASRIQAERDKIFTSSYVGSAQQGMSTDELIQAEASRISIVNESGDPALGDQTAGFLKARGFNVVQVGQGSSTRARTRLVEQTYDPYTTRYLINNLKISPGEIYEQFQTQPDADIVLYLGQDLAADNLFPK